MDRVLAVFVTVIVSALLVAVAAGRASGFGRNGVLGCGVTGILLYGLFLVVKPDGWLLIDVVVLLAATAIGSGIGLFLASKSALVAFVIAASIVDIVSATRGITAKLVDGYQDGTNELMNYLVISIPWHGEIVPVVGIGDFFILAALGFALPRLGYMGPLAFIAPLLGLFIALAVGLAIGGIFAIPFIAATTLAVVYWKGSDVAPHKPGP